LSQLLGKTREGYYSVSREKREAIELTENEIVETVKDLRSQAPGIGAFKLFLILQDIYPDKMVGRDRFYKLMHDHNLMLKPERRRHTTNSNHNYRKYSNLIKEFRPTRINQLWVADITYIETDEGVMYLHLLTDAYTHEIIGWTLSNSLMAENTIKSLTDGINNVGKYGLNGLIHHSDRGSQYCSNAYVAILNSINVAISMTEDYAPTDNPIAERVNGIIKQEWLYRMKRPKDLEDAKETLSKIIDFYNNIRPHMNNQDMLPPTKFKNKLTA
jgi:transposase InsO family protein